MNINNQEEMLLKFYIDQYRQVSTKNNRKKIKTKSYMHRLNAKARSLARAIVTPGQENMVTQLHGDVKKLAYLAYYTNNKEAVKVLNKQIMPHVVDFCPEFVGRMMFAHLGKPFGRGEGEEIVAAVHRMLYLDRVGDDIIEAQMEEKGEDSEQAQIEAFYAMKNAK